MKKLSEKGFTLVEIVIVLAIAGLIMVIVFVGVQGAQRARRDAVRKNDNARIAALLEQFRSNSTAAAYPTEAEFDNGGAFNTGYIDVDATFNGYTFTGTGALTACVGTNAGTASYDSTATTYTLRMCLESGQDVRSQ